MTFFSRISNIAQPPRGAGRSSPAEATASAVTNILGASAGLTSAIVGGAADVAGSVAATVPPPPSPSSLLPGGILPDLGIRPPITTPTVPRPPIATLPTLPFPTLPTLPTVPLPIPFDPPIRPPITPPVGTIPEEKTATQLANGAIDLLNRANRATLQEALNTIANTRVAANRLTDYLERRTRVGEVMNELAKDWETETKQDFAEAFRMDVGKLDVMDALVSIAVLNDPDLEDQLRVENMNFAQGADLARNRVITDQYPPAGTALRPPYIILVAVQQVDLQAAERVIQSITGQLVMHNNIKLPRAAVQKLG